MSTTVPGVGDIVFLSQALAKMYFYGVVTPPDSPDQFAASMELHGDEGVVTMPVLVGEQGPAGEPCFALRFQNDMSVQDVADLPKTLTNTVADIGKYFIIDDLDGNGIVVGSSAYIWYGRAYRRMMMGSAGPPGPLPIITPSVELVPPEQTSTIVTGGSAYQPSWHMRLAVPQGPPGPPTTIASAPDTDFITREAEPGDVLGFTGRYTKEGDPIWVPVSISALIPSPFSVPQSAFRGTEAAIGQQGLQIGSFALPQQPFPWTPIVWGHFFASGFELDKTPLEIGSEVRLGDPKSGVLVGRGYGKSQGHTTVMPHYSSPNNTGAAITPTNGRAVVPANHTNPAQGTLYISLRNEGVIGAYRFDPEDAQLFVMVVPMEQQPLTTTSPNLSVARPEPDVSQVNVVPDRPA